MTYRYRLEAANGIPADFYVKLPTVLAGAWSVNASWDGRGMAGLWLMKPDGKVLMKRIAASPLDLAFEVDESWADRGEELVIRFASTTDRGELDGELTVTPPALDDPANAEDEDEPQGEALSGPGRCLAPGFDDGPVGRTLKRLASSLETSPEDDASWCVSWVHRVVEAVEREDGARERRATLDTLWESLLADKKSEAPVGHAMRHLLSTLEELVRREQAAKDPSVARRRHDELVELLNDCL